MGTVPYTSGCRACGGQVRMRAHADKGRFRYDFRHTKECRLYDGTVLWAAEYEQKIGHQLPDSADAGIELIKAGKPGKSASVLRSFEGDTA